MACAARTWIDPRERLSPEERAWSEPRAMPASANLQGAAAHSADCSSGYDVDGVLAPVSSDEKTSTRPGAGTGSGAADALCEVESDISSLRRDAVSVHESLEALQIAQAAATVKLDELRASMRAKLDALYSSSECLAGDAVVADRDTACAAASAAIAALDCAALECSQQASRIQRVLETQALQLDARLMQHAGDGAADGTLSSAADVDSTADDAVDFNAAGRAADDCAQQLHDIRERSAALPRRFEELRAALSEHGAALERYARNRALSAWLLEAIAGLSVDGDAAAEGAATSSACGGVASSSGGEALGLRADAADARSPAVVAAHAQVLQRHLALALTPPRPPPLLRLLGDPRYLHLDLRSATDPEVVGDTLLRAVSSKLNVHKFRQWTIDATRAYCPLHNDIHSSGNAAVLRAALFAREDVEQALTAMGWDGDVFTLHKRWEREKERCARKARRANESGERAQSELDPLLAAWGKNFVPTVLGCASMQGFRQFGRATLANMFNLQSAVTYVRTNRCTYFVVGAACSDVQDHQVEVFLRLGRAYDTAYRVVSVQSNPQNTSWTPALGPFQQAYTVCLRIDRQKKFEGVA